MPRGRSISSCLDCAEPTNPTGPPSTAAGTGAPSSMSSSSRNSAVGALPMASTAPSSRSAHRSTPAAERVMPEPRRVVGRPRIGDQGHHLVVRGQPRPGDPGGDHRRIAQHRGAGGQRGVGAGDDVGGEGDVLGDVDLAAGVDQPHDHPRDVVGEPGQIRFGADGGERLPVDLGGVADVVEHAAHPTGGVTAGRGRYPSPVATSTSPHRGAPAGPLAPDEMAVARLPVPPTAAAASARTSATACAQPGLPVHALTPTPR